MDRVPVENCNGGETGVPFVTTARLMPSEAVDSSPFLLCNPKQSFKLLGGLGEKVWRPEPILYRPVARIGVAGALVVLSLFLFNSILSTAFFVLALMGLSYFLYIAFNTDEGPRGGGGGGGGPLSEDESLKEARRIMDKYK